LLIFEKKLNMSKSLLITYNDADEAVLLTVLKKFKVKIQAVDDLSTGVPLRVAKDMVIGLENLKKGNIGQDAYELLEELRSEMSEKPKAKRL
jgi:uncharacterized membrane protein YcaP (DUF421 family)